MQPESGARVISANSAGIAEIRMGPGQAPAVYEMVRFPLQLNGRSIELLGEITELDGDTAIVQLYEGAEALAVGNLALPTGEPSICQVAPGMPGIRMSGLGSSLDSMPGQHMPRGEHFSPLAGLRAGFAAVAKTGDKVSAGTLLGQAHVANRNYRVNTPIDRRHRDGIIDWLAAPGEYAVGDPIATIRYGAQDTRVINMISSHPVRQPRPVQRHLRTLRPLFTGKRAIDSSMLLLEGGKFIVIGGAGTGKTWFTQDLAKYSNVDLVVLVLCGERSGEATEVVVNYQETGLMERTVVILNTSAQSAQARGQSVRFGAAVCEGLRDMGMNVLMIVDSLSRQGQGDRETAGMLGKMPGRQSFPVDMPSVMAATFERCGRATCLGGFDASITGVMAVSPDGDDYEGDAIAQVARQYADGTVILTNKVAHRGHFPAVGFGLGLSSTKTTGLEKRAQLDKYFTQRDLGEWIELGQHIAAVVADSEGPLTDQIKVLTAKRMGAEDYRRYLLGSIYRRAFFVQDSGHPIDQQTSPERLMIMMRFVQRLGELFPLLKDKDRARQLADQLGGQAFDVTTLEHDYEQAYADILDSLQATVSGLTQAEDAAPGATPGGTHAAL
jgi:V/A-type H+-transporting ATPase subunit A